MFTKKREKGFTLVELLVVITIMGVLGTLLVTNYTKYVDKSKQVVVDEQLTEVIKTFEIAIMENTKIGEKVITSYADIKGLADAKTAYETLSGNSLPASSTLTIDDKVVTYSNNGKTASYAYSK
ncbi:MAG: type II secretion system protein [Bacilli bacterium]|nr:type II secretion system GspH family protein [Mollicutes bacterium]MDY3899860.1 type II secretion system protein [Bacilli bacterium]